MSNVHFLSKNSIFARKLVKIVIFRQIIDFWPFGAKIQIIEDVLVQIQYLDQKWCYNIV